MEKETRTIYRVFSKSWNEIVPEVPEASIKPQKENKKFRDDVIFVPFEVDLEKVEDITENTFYVSYINIPQERILVECRGMHWFAIRGSSLQEVKDYLNFKEWESKGTRREIAKTKNSISRILRNTEYDRRHKIIHRIIDDLEKVVKAA